VSKSTTASFSAYPLEIPDALWQTMLMHVTACLPEEACGLVATGRKEPVSSHASELPVPMMRAAAILPIENELHSPVRYRMAPAEQLKAFYWLEEHGLELGGIFHSHPKGPDQPSATDLAEFAYPGVLMLILSPINPMISPQQPADWKIRAYRIDSGISSHLSASEVPLAHLADRNESSDEGL
jgi:proteasome lid subunit RPN8/RPN11